MIRCGICHDNAVTESLRQLVKLELIKKKIYGTLEKIRNYSFD